MPAEPLTPSTTRSNFWTRPRTLDHQSSAGATLLTHAQIKFYFMARWAGSDTISARQRISAPSANTA